MRVPTVRAPGEVLFTILALMVMVSVLVVAWGYGAPARTLPLVIGVPTCVLLVVHLLRLTVFTGAAPADLPAEAVAAERIAGAAGAIDTPGVEAVQAEVETPALPLRRELVALGWLAVLGLTVVALGFMIGLPLFMLVFFRLQGRERWVLSLVVTAGVSAFLYLFLVRFVGLIPYPGLFGVGG